MSSLQKRGLESFPEESDPHDVKTCWEALSCSKLLCPSYGRSRGEECWLTPGTHCGETIEYDFFKKFASCLKCAYFKKRSKRIESVPEHFLSEQIQRYIFKSLEQIYQKEESFIEILDRIPDGLFTTDREWRITYFNPAAEKITGFSAEDAVGMYCKDVFKNPICETDCALKRAVANGTNILNREYEIVNIEGERIPIICSTSAFKDRSGRITGGLEIFKDITELKRLQEEVASREKKYRRIFEGSHDMIYTTNQGGKILDVNQAGVELLGYRNREELLGIGSARRLYKDPKDRDKFLKRITREGYVKDFEVDFVKRDGDPIHVLISSRRYQNPQSGSTEFEGIIKDITQRKRTEETLRQRNRELSILNSIAVALNLTMDLNHILRVTLRNVLKVLRLRRGALFLIDREKRKVTLQVSSGLPQDKPETDLKIDFKDAMLMRHLVEEEAALKPQPLFPPFKVRYLTEKRSSPWLTCFLISFKGRGVGFFGLDIHPSRELSPHEFHLLGSLGNFLGGAIENAQLVKTIRSHRQELRRLTEKLFQSQEEERRRIARELHDEAGQALTAVKLGLDRLEERVNSGKGDLQEEIGEIRKMIVRTSSEIRRLSYSLHPTLLRDLGLEPALRLHFKEISNHSGLEIDFNLVGFDRRLDRDMETVIYRFSQEALTNTLKHSGAEHFSLSLIKGYPKIIFIAEDDGTGFDGQIRSSDKWSLGLLGMRERTLLLGGTFQLHSRLGQGTRIRIEIPLVEARSHEKSD